MNVNLISPIENGNSFVVRFKDDIIIPENSKVYLNFASFSRENDVELYEDQTLKLIFKNSDVYPSKIATSPFNDNTLLASPEFTIPKGTYNYQRLYQLITKGFNDLLTNAGNISDMAMYKAIAIADIDNTDDQISKGEVSFSLGLMKSNPDTVPHKAFEIDIANFINGDNNGGDDSYQKTTADKFVGLGLKKSAGSAGFATAFRNVGTNDKTVGSYADVPLTSSTGLGTNATINFDVVDVGMNVPQPFGTGFTDNGSPDKNVGDYTNIPLLKSNAGATGITIDFSVAEGGTGTGVGPIVFGGIAVNNNGVGGNYTAGEELRIDNSATGGSQDTTLTVRIKGGQITFASVRVEDIGDNYSVGDVLTIPNTGGVGGTADTAFTVATLQNGAGSAIFDNYALAEKHYWHIGYDDDTPVENCNIIKFTSKNTLQHMLDNDSAISLGLYSREVAQGINGADGTFPLDSTTRTGGLGALTPDGIHINPHNLPDEFNTGAKQLSAFVNITIDGRGAVPFLKIFVAQSNLGVNLPSGQPDTTFKTNGLHNWTAPHRKITKMKNCSIAGRANGIDLTTLTGVSLTSQVALGLQTYYDVNELNEEPDGAGKLYFRVLNLNGYVDGKKSVAGNSIVLYDSKSIGDINKKSHFPPAFFKPAENLVSLDPTKGGISNNMTNHTLNIGTGNRTVGVHNVDLGGGTGAGARLTIPVVARRGDNTIALNSLSSDLSKYTVDIGTGSRTDGNFTNVDLGGGTGTGARCTIQILGNAIHTVIFTDNGTGYALGDVLTIPNTDIGGNADATLTINLGGLQNVSVLDIGDGYTVGDVLTIGSARIGGNADATLTIGGAVSNAGLVNRINAQMPFNVITSALTQNDGFSHIDMPSYTKSDTKPLAFLVKYEMEATDELSRYLGFTTSLDRSEGLSTDLFPNTGDAMNRNLIHLEGMTLDWRNESYSVSIKELPIKNYKNNEFLRNGGFSKPILANCPVPFSDAQSYQTKSKQMITATYKPNYQVINNLYNQAFTTNKFSVDINKLNSEKPANEIKKSVVNFTILPPDDYKGNLNSISGL